jgi:hypothetical protein
VLLILAFVFIVTAFAQTGTVTGKISDVIGMAVGGASIQANMVKGPLYKTTTTPGGIYAWNDLPEGTYEISVRMAGMKNYVQENIVVHNGQTVRVDITLQDNAQLGTLGDGDRFARARKIVPPMGPTPRCRTAHPISPDSGRKSPRDTDAEQPYVLPWAEAVATARIANDFRDLPPAYCLPPGVTISAGRGKFVQTPILLVILSEFPGNSRQVFLDGRSHPTELDVKRRSVEC